MSKPSIQSTVIPETWNPNPSDKEFNKWVKYIAGIKPTNQFKKDFDPNYGERLLKEANQLITR